MDLHGVSESDLDESVVTVHWFKFHGKREYSLLGQVFYKVIGTHGYSTYESIKNGRKVAYTRGVDCTAGQAVEIAFLFDFYRELYQQEEKRFYSAFLQKHEIFGKAPEGYEPPERSKEEELKEIMLMKGMEDATPHKRLTEPPANKGV
jgi:hypothetical protein